MSANHAQSIISPGTTPTDEPRPELSYRKYGPIGFDRFDNILSQFAPIGTSSIGKVNVDCKFLFKKSQWGVLSGKNPAGIVYLDLSIQQPQDHRLKDAKLTVRLDEDNEELSKLHIPPWQPTKIPVQIGLYGPKQLNGPPKYVVKTNSQSYRPHFEGYGFGLGGVGPESKSEMVQECRWMFSGRSYPNPKSKNRPRACQIVEWCIEENQLETQSSHPNTIHTAFSFEHGGQPFLMHVSVEGRLQSRRSEAGKRVKEGAKWGLEKLLKFKSKSEDISDATTLINFGGRRFSKSLDELEKGLDAAMQQENMSLVPVEIPDSYPTTFRDIPLLDPLPAGHAIPASDPLNQHLLAKPQNSGEAHLAENISGLLGDPCLPTNENLEHALSALLTLSNVQRRVPPSNSSVAKNFQRKRRHQYTGGKTGQSKVELKPEHSNTSSTIMVEEASGKVLEETHAHNHSNAPDSSVGTFHSMMSLLGLVHITWFFRNLIASFGMALSSASFDDWRLTTRTERVSTNSYDGKGQKEA